MGSIYNGSMVTIAATSAASGHDGLFNTLSSPVLPRDPDREISLESRLSCGSSSILCITSPDVFTGDSAAWTDHIVKAPLMQPAWVCQERMSSPRIIHYTSAQLFWECEHCTLSEDNAVISSWGLSADSRARSLFLSLYQSNVSEEWDMASVRNSLVHRLNQWYSDLIGDQYSRCGLTFNQDKLVAISGLAKLIHDKTSIPYFAGHWFPNETWFLSSLDWQRDSAGSKTREYRAPSWSWASQDSSVMFSGVGASFATLHSRLVHLSMNDNVKGPAATLGLLRAGEPELVLEGPMLPLVLRYIPYTNMWDVLKNADGSDLGFQFHYLDDDTEPPNGILSYALALTSRASIGKAPRVVCFLILEKVDPVAETPTMKRIGYGDASTDGEWAQKLLVAPVARVRTI